MLRGDFLFNNSVSYKNLFVLHKSFSNLMDSVKLIENKDLRCNCRNCILWTNVIDKTESRIATHWIVVFTAVFECTNQKTLVTTFWYPPTRWTLIICWRWIHCQITISEINGFVSQFIQCVSRNSISLKSENRV